MAGAFTAVDLSQLPVPDSVDRLDFETIFADMLADLIARAPEFTALVESDTVYKVLEVCAFRELLLRQKANDDIQAVMLATALGDDLENIAARYDVERLLIQAGDPDAVPPIPDLYEDDEALRRRTQLAFEGFSTAGPKGAYIFHSLSADARVLDANAESLEPGKVSVAVLARAGTGEAPQDLLDVVDAALSDEDVRPLTDQVEVVSADILEFQVAATLKFYSGPDSAAVMAAVRAALQSYLDDSQRLGRDIAVSGLYRALHQPGVQSAFLTQPATNIVAAWNQAPLCTLVTLTDGGVDE
jgi:phage-related baseplate assembly protein